MIVASVSSNQITASVSGSSVTAAVGSSPVTASASGGVGPQGSTGAIGPAGSAIDGAADVELAGLTDGDVLRYSGSSARWQNYHESGITDGGNF